jgi:hypothetical protein
VPSYFFLVIYENSEASRQSDVAGILRFVRFAPDPTKDVAVTIPEELILPETIFPTVILGLPERPKEVVANETEEIPVNPLPLPIKLFAVTIPVTLIPLGLMLSIDEPEETTVTCPNVGEKNPV